MSKYKANNTMKLLGYQYWVDDEARNQIEGVLSAYEKDFKNIKWLQRVG